MERLQRAYDVGIQWVAFPLHPDTPEDGLELERLFPPGSVDVNEILSRLRGVADQEGLPFGDRKKTFNSRLAQELSKWAEARGKGEAFHRAVFHAYFAEGLNIGKVHHLVRIAETLGLPGREAREVLIERSWKKAVDVDWARSRTLGVTAVPTLRLHEGMLVGAQPYGVLEKLMEDARVKRRDSLSKDEP